MKFIKRHKILITILVLVGLFVGYNLINELSVERVEQNNTPSAKVISKSESAKDLASGTFGKGVGTYTGSGSAKFVQVDGKNVLQFGEDFKTTTGPDLQVYLSPNSDAVKDGLGEFVTLGGLKSQNGAQTYTLPDNYKDYDSVVVWCRSFKGVFTQAPLDFN